MNTAELEERESLKAIGRIIDVHTTRIADVQKMPLGADRIARVFEARVEAVNGMTAAAETLATHRAVELAEKVIGSDVDVVNVYPFPNWQITDQAKFEAASAEIVNWHKKQQRAALAQLQGEGNE